MISAENQRVLTELGFPFRPLDAVSRPTDMMETEKTPEPSGEMKQSRAIFSLCRCNLHEILPSSAHRSFTAAGGASVREVLLPGPPTHCRLSSPLSSVLHGRVLLLAGLSLPIRVPPALQAAERPPHWSVHWHVRCQQPQGDEGALNVLNSTGTPSASPCWGGTRALLSS